jgi:hypothetical protein
MVMVVGNQSDLMALTQLFIAKCCLKDICITNMLGVISHNSKVMGWVEVLYNTNKLLGM